MHHGDGCLKCTGHFANSSTINTQTPNARSSEVPTHHQPGLSALPRDQTGAILLPWNHSAPSRREKDPNQMGTLGESGGDPPSQVGRSKWLSCPGRSSSYVNVGSAAGLACFLPQEAGYWPGWWWVWTSGLARPSGGPCMDGRREVGE